MPSYSPRSKANLDTGHDELKLVFHTAINYLDHTVLCGHRGKEAQDQALKDGTTTKAFPLSPHNVLPSDAIDAAPYYPEVPAGGIDWRTDAALLKAAMNGNMDEVKAILENIKRWYHFGGFIKGVAAGKGVELEWGGDWDGDFRFNDHRLIDLPHFQRAKK
jgi:peptidoglycan L-alanyl-D-glutamate endopeptidase CwlK